METQRYDQHVFFRVEKTLEDGTVVQVLRCPTCGQEAPVEAKSPMFTQVGECPTRPPLSQQALGALQQDIPVCPKMKYLTPPDMVDDFLEYVGIEKHAGWVGMLQEDGFYYGPLDDMTLIVPTGTVPALHARAVAAR